jgi:DNA (cytosine-5)-methyltransferase 1
VLRVLDLFSGIGGFSRGLEATGGFQTVAFCEIDPFCQKILRKHWPNIPIFEDVTLLTVNILKEIGNIDVICGGFPCQPCSVVGKMRGDCDERWLWPEFYRIVREVRLEWVLIENVPGLLSANSGRLFAGILRDLSVCGYDAEWNIVSAASVGAPHLRKRVFVVAHTSRAGLAIGQGPERERSFSTIAGSGRGATERGVRRVFDGVPEGIHGPWEPGWYDEVPTIVKGQENRVNRIKALGNAICPQVAQYVGMCVLSSFGPPVDQQF